MDMQKLMKEAQKMQKELTSIQGELEDKIYESQTSLIKTVMNGKKQLLSLEILDKDIVDKDDLDMLSDAIIVAVNDVIKKIEDEKNKKLSKYGQGMSGLL